MALLYEDDKSTPSPAAHSTVADVSETTELPDKDELNRFEFQWRYCMQGVNITLNMHIDRMDTTKLTKM